MPNKQQLFSQISQMRGQHRQALAELDAILGAFNSGNKADLQSAIDRYETIMGDVVTMFTIKDITVPERKIAPILTEVEPAMY